jgi:dihydropyrimidinase
MKTLIRNGLVCFEDRLARTDILVVDHAIADVRQNVPSTPADETIDAEGTYVLPGLIDIHTHVDDRIGSYELADTYESGSRVAVENGVTTIFTFVTQQAEESLSDAVTRAARKAKGRCHANYMWHLTPTMFDERGWREIRQWIDRGFHTFKFYTTYKRAGIFSDYDRLDTLFGMLAPMGVRFLIHCEDESILTKAQESKPDLTEAVSHALLRPAGAEVEAIRHVVRLAEKHNAQVHIVHVSTPEGADIVADAKSRARVTCETAPQYVFLNEDRLRGTDGRRWICSPPLRSEERRNALAARTAAGMVDLFATDHCAFRRKDKDAWTGDVRDVPNGLPGIGALPAMMLNLYLDRLPDGLVDYAHRLSTNPAKVTGIYPRKGTIAVGSDADIVLLRTDGNERPIRSTHADAHEPYPNHTSRLRIERVLLAGATVVKEGTLVAPEKPKGQCLCRW